MSKAITLGFPLLLIVALGGTALAQSPASAGAGFEKKEFTYEDFAKARRRRCVNAHKAQSGLRTL